MAFMTVLAVFVLLPGAFTGAAAAESSFLAELPPKTVKLNEVVTFMTKAGYHFNLKAPQNCGVGSAIEVTTADLKCQFTSGGKQPVSLKICDEKSTFCASEDFDVLVEGRVSKPGAAAGRTIPASEPWLKGFLLNAPSEALRRAKAEHKLLFIDFFGKWCPPCRMMEDTVLNQQAFLDASRNMVLISLDIDRPEAQKWLSLFHPSGYPAYVVADLELREIGRSVGSHNLEAFVAWVKKQEAWKDRPIAKAKLSASSLDEAGKLRVAEVYIEEGKWLEARGLLAGLKSRYALYLEACARVKGEEAGDSKNMAALYRELIERFDGRDGQDAITGVTDWIAELHKLDPAAAKPYIDSLETLAERLLRSREAAAEGYIAPDIFVNLAEAMDQAGLSDQARAFYDRASYTYAALAEKAASPELAKGLRMSQGRYLSRVKRYSDAASVYGALAEKFPGEYEFHYSYANALFELKKYSEALREVSSAEKLSYGDIGLHIMLLKARIEMAQKNKAGALKTLREAIAGADLPGDSTLSLHRTYQLLKDYLKEVEAVQ